MAKTKSKRIKAEAPTKRQQPQRCAKKLPASKAISKQPAKKKQPARAAKQTK